MKDLIIGINLPDNTAFEHLGQSLDTYAANGFDAVEINMETYPLIIGGRICLPWLKLVKEELLHHPLLYSAHIGRGLDLRDLSQAPLHAAVLTAAMDICAELHMPILVLHYEAKSQDQAKERYFIEAHRKAAERAAQLGITLCVENIEVELIDPVVDLVREIDHPNLRLTFDTGHAYLASRYFHFDFFNALTQMIPYLGHIHLSDNIGIYEELRITNRAVYDVMPMPYRRELGRGDIHLPPYYGTIPYDAIFQRLFTYRGWYICEYTSKDFDPLNADIQKHVRSQIYKARAKA